MKDGDEGGLGWAVDHHVHSVHSWDGGETVAACCRRAVELNLYGVVFTDHVELDREGGRERPYRYGEAAAAVEGARRENPRIYVGLGVEVTYLRSLEGDIRRFLRSREFDAVMGSLHQVAGVDCSDPAARAVLAASGTDPAALLRAYCEELRGAVESGLFDVLGHVDVFLRLGSDLWPHLGEEVEGRLGEVLGMAARAGVAVEVNTSGLRLGLGHPHPAPAFLEAYRRAGGRLVTLGSDAHRVAHMAGHFAEAAALLVGLGFEHTCFFRARRAHLLALPGGEGEPYRRGAGGS